MLESIMVLDREDNTMSKYLLVIDLQKQFKDKGGEYERCLQFIKEHGHEYDWVFATVFRQSPKENANYIQHLNWKGCLPEQDEDDNIVSLVKNWLEFKPPLAIRKCGYGHDCLNQLFFDDDEIHIIGCDLDACVMAICFNLWDAGFTNFKVLTEYCYTTAKDFTKEDVIKIMRRNFGDCIV